MDAALAAYRPRPRQLPIAREGLPFLGIAAGAAALAWLTGANLIAGALLGCALFIAFFFRNPERRVPEGAGLVVAPADGRVIAVREGEAMPLGGRPATRVSIFMSVLNVHINRSPVAGRVREVAYRAGRFFVASRERASELNEQNALLIDEAGGRTIVVVQIAGYVARRIVCYLRPDDAAERGERLGLIRFGSRVDLYLPPETAIAVAEGDRVRAGETIIGRWS